MSIKTKLIIKNILKITIVSLVLSILFFFVSNLVGAGEKEKIEIDEKNNINYVNTSITPIGNVGVAITSNIGIGIKNNEKINERKINNKIFEAEDFYRNNEKIKSELITKNIIFVKEYFNILNINFNQTIKNSKNREKTLNNIIKQLGIRINNASSNMSNIIKQREILISENQKLIGEIEESKSNLEKSFNEYNTKNMFINISGYYNLKEKQTTINTNTIILGELIKRYNSLNNYNRELINTLTKNKDIISKNSYIVIPKSGTKILKEFDLIIEENEIK